MRQGSRTACPRRACRHEADWIRLRPEASSATLSELRSPERRLLWLTAARFGPHRPAALAATRSLQLSPESVRRTRGGWASPASNPLTAGLAVACGAAPWPSNPSARNARSILGIRTRAADGVSPPFVPAWAGLVRRTSSLSGARGGKHRSFSESCRDGRFKPPASGTRAARVTDYPQCRGRPGGVTTA